MDQKQTDRDQFTRIYWSTQQFEKYICTLCYFLVFPPMQLICCGQRICEACSTSRLKQLSQCPFCPEEGVPQAKHDRGYRRELDRLQINCPRCNDQWSGLFTDLPVHLNTHCDLECGNCDQKFIFPQQVEKHQQSDCANRVVPCPLAFLGCSSKVPYQKIHLHYLEKTHQQCLTKFIRQLLLLNSSRNPKLITQKIHNEKYHGNLVECLGKIGTLLEEVNPLIANCTQLNSMQQSIETKIKEVRTQVAKKIKETSDNSGKLLESLQEILMNMHKLMDEIKSKPTTGPNVLSLDNTYIWKVSFAALLANTQPITSDPIHTSQSGYRLSLNCEIFIDGPKQKRYISISLTVLKGEFDAILSWPINYPISLSIIDLTATKQHISHSIPCDSRATTFHRPINDKNFPFRISQFYPVDALIAKGSNYIQEEFMFIELSMDFTAPSANSSPNKILSKPIEDAIQRNIVQNMS